MRGVAPFDIPTPLQGILLDRPTQQVGLDGILAGYNMMLDADGYYRPRNGYKQWIATNPTEPLYGMAFYVDTDGSYQYVGAGNADVWAVVANAWANQGGSLGGDSTDLVSVIPFLQPWVSGLNTSVLSAIFCNNIVPLALWNQTLTAAQTVTPTHAAGSGNTLAFNTVPSFGVYGTSPPGPTWFFTVTGTNSGNTTMNINSVGAQPLRYVNTSGAIAELPSSYLVPGTIYNISWDGAEFLIGTNVQAPIARAICALNGRIVAVNVQSLSSTGALLPRVPNQVAWSSVFDATSWPADAYQNLVDTDDPLIGVQKIGFSAAVVYGELSGYLMQGVYGAGDAGAFSFTPINGYTVGPVSPLAIVPYSGGHLFLGRDFRVWATDGINAQPYSISYGGTGGVVTSLLQSIINPALQTSIFSFLDPRERRIYWFFQQNNQKTSSGLVLELDQAPHFETIQTYPTLFTAITNAEVNAGQTWASLTNPWSTYTQSWSSFLGVGQLIHLACDSSPTVHLFGNSGGNLDNGVNQVAYSYTPGLMTAGAAQDIRPESMDFFCKPTAILELATVQFDALQYPDDPGTTILAVPLAFNDPASFTIPQVYPEMTTYGRYLRMTISGYSYSRACAFGGGRLYTNVLNRASV